MGYQEKITLAWQRYEAGRMYNNSLTPNQYSLVNTNVEFFAGNQWLHLPQTAAMSRLPKPVFNIIKRIASLFVASLTSSGITIQFEPLTYYDGENLSDPESNAAAYATAEVQNILEKCKIEYRAREALFDGAQTGDYCAHFYWDADALPYGGAFGNHRGEIRMELVDGINVMFGNPNTPDVSRQPYILLVGRDTVENLRAEYRQHNKKDGLWAEHMIQPDRDYAEQAGVGGKTELMNIDDISGKCLYVYMYERKTREEDLIDPKTGQPVMETVVDAKGDPVQAKDASGKPIINPDGTPVYKRRKARRRVTTVHVTKATKSCVIYEDIDTGLDRYPIAWGNWEKQKNQYHGRSLVTGIIPNQIFTNTMLAMVMRHLQLMGFPKTVYNADLISQWSNEVGQAIGVRGLQPGQSISQVATNLQPANMSEHIIAAIDRVVALTKECLGATDVQMGNVKPDNTSALMVMQTNAEVPLENIRAGLYEWVEDIGAILLDMMGTYYGKRPIVRDRTFEEPVIDPATGIPKVNQLNGQMEMKRVTRRVSEEFDFSQFKHLWMNIRADVGATSQFSEIAMVQTLDNLRANGTLDVIQYLERIPDKLIPKRAELIEELKTRMGMQAEQLAMQGQSAQNGAAAGAAAAAQMLMAEGGPTVGGPLNEKNAFAAMPDTVQEEYKKMPNRVKGMMKKQANAETQAST